MKIRLVCMNGGKAFVDGYAKEGVKLADTLALAEKLSQNCEYVRAEVDGEIYVEYDS